MNQSNAQNFSRRSPDVKIEAKESNSFERKSVHASIALRLELQKLQANYQVRSKAKDILRVGLERPLVQAADRRLARVAESDVLFFRFIFFKLFEVNTELAWRNKPMRFTSDGWRRTYHAEIREQTGLSKREVRRKIPRFLELGLIETDHEQRDYSLALKGLFIRPNPAKVMELLNGLPAIKKVQKDRYQPPNYHDPLADIGVVQEGPITPHWLREREIATRLLYFSNFRSVLPTAIRYHKTLATQRRAIRDKRKAVVPDGLIKFALAMTEIFGVDELGNLLDWPDLFDTEGARIISVPELMKETECTRREVREAVAFYQQNLVYRGFFKQGAKYTGSRDSVPRIPWVSWSFSKFAEFLQFPGSRLQWDDEPLRFVLLDPDESRDRKPQPEDEEDSPADDEVRAMQLELSLLNDIEGPDQSGHFSTSFLPSSLNAINGQAIVVYKEPSNAICQSPIANCSGIQRERREKPASPAFSSFLEKDPAGNCHQANAGNPAGTGVAERPNVDSGTVAARDNGQGHIAIAGQNGHFPNGHWPGGSNSRNHAQGRQALPWAPDATIPRDYYDWAISAHQRLMERDSAALPTPRPAELLKEMNPSFPFIGQLCNAANGEYLENRLFLYFSSFAKRWLSPQARKALGDNRATALDGAAVELGESIIALVPERVAFCAAILQAACEDSDTPDHLITQKRLARVWKLVRTEQMSPDSVAWYLRRRWNNGFEDLEEWLNRAPLKILLSRWQRVVAARAREEKNAQMEKLVMLPSASFIEHCGKWLEAELTRFVRKRPGERAELIVVLAWMHRQGGNVKRDVPQVILDRLANELRTTPWLYTKLRTVLPLDEWCGFVEEERRSLEREARKHYEKALIRDSRLKDFGEQENRREEQFEEWKEDQQAKKEGGLTRPQLRALDAEWSNLQAQARIPRSEFLTRCVPTCLQGLNQALGGGFDRPSVTLISAITGGGKTLLCLQLAYGFAAEGRKVLFLSAEAENGLDARVCTNALGIPYGEVLRLLTKCKRGRLLELLEEQYADRKGSIIELQDLLDQRLLICPWPVNPTMPDLGALAGIDQAHQRGFTPDVIILDGFSNAASDAASVMKSKRRFGWNIRGTYLEAVNQAFRISETEKCVALATVQANKAKGGRVKAVTARMIQDVPDLFAFAERKFGFIGISRLRGDVEEGMSALEPVQFLNVLPTLDGPGGLVRVRAEFQYQRFADCARAIA